MIRLYRRHLKSCPHTSERERRCKCPIHCEGQLGEERIKPQSLNLTSWEAATKKIRDWEVVGTMRVTQRIKLSEAIAGYKGDAVARSLSSGTLHKISTLLEALQNFAERRGLTLLEQIDVCELRAFRASWTSWGPLVQVKSIERLRAFFRFCQQSKWIAESPAQFLKPPKVEPTTIAVFTDAELSKLQATIRRPIMRAFVLTLLYTGLRISDAVRLRKQEIVDSKLCIRTKKTKALVWLPLPPALLEALEALKATDYYFWTGESKLSTVIGSKRRGLAKLLKRAGVEGNPHKFRHTLATNLLANGARPAIVAKILGNSERVVIKYYDHWIPARQNQLEAELKKTW